MDPITVYLDGVAHGFRRGAEVHLLVARLPEALRDDVVKGKAFIADAAGHELGSGGALHDGQRLLFLRRG